MAQKIITQTLSDLSGVEEAKTVPFGLDGTQYEIDLTDKEAAAFRKKIAPYVEKGRKVAGPGRGRRGAGARRAAVRPGGTSTKAIREWARSQGFEVTDRGRIPNEIMEKFEATHPT